MAKKKDSPSAAAASQESFDKQKASTLSALLEDKSRKGSVDEPIADFVSSINAHPDLVTLSSCSGRILISSGAKNKNVKWIYSSHKLGLKEELLQSVEEGLKEHQSEREEENVFTFKMEAFILHVQCRNMETARKFLQLANESGFRNSGISLSKSGKIVLAIRSSHGLEVPLFILPEGLSVSKDYLAQLLEYANEKLRENERRHIDLFARFGSVVWSSEEEEKNCSSTSPKIQPTRLPKKDKKKEEFITLDPLLDLEDSLKDLLEEA